MTATFESLMAIDRELVAAGHHPLTPWWQEQLERWYRHPTARTLVARVGRGGTKSHVSVKVSLNEILNGDWDIPQGERHSWAYVSTSKDEAAQRLTLIQRFLSDLQIPCERDGVEIRLVDEPRGWRVFAAQIAGASGFRCLGFTADELTKWRSADRLANPAKEVLASLRATAITHRGTRRLLVSSPMGMSDEHFKLFDKGNNAEQLICQAPTWVANPSITEAETHAEEPDERIWRREYAAIPQAGSLSVFEPEAIVRAFAQPIAVPKPFGRFGVIDASSGKKDAWTFGVGSWCDVAGKKQLVFDKIDGFGGSFFQQQSGEAIVQAVADCLKSFGVRSVMADQRESLMLRSAFQRQGIKFFEHPWTQPNKERAVGIVRRWLAEDRLVLPEHEKMKDELLEFEERTTTSGAFTFGARGSGHDDYVALLITTAIAESERQLTGSPSKRNGMIEALQQVGARERLEALEKAAGLRS